MKAFLLAAGLGTRLKPYTDTIPKCLLPIRGKPLLQIWLELLERHRVAEVLINIHHHPEKVAAFIAGIQPALGIRIVPYYEKTLLGSAGTIAANRNFVAGCDDFIIAYADNLTCVDLTAMVAFHRRMTSKGGVLTMGLMRASDPRRCGIAIMDSEKRIVNFVEKPQNPLGNMASGGIYITNDGLFGFIPEPAAAGVDAIVDLGYDVLPRLCGRMFGYEIREYLRDIGTPESYRAALREWPELSCEAQ